MKYIYALVAVGGVIFSWAILSVAVGWQRGGGIIGMLVMWAVAAGVWNAIMSHYKEESKTTSDKSDNSNPATTESHPNTSFQDRSIQYGTASAVTITCDEQEYYNQATKEYYAGEKSRPIATWGKAWYFANGDEFKARDKYIELRINELKAMHRASLSIEQKQNMKVRCSRCGAIHSANDNECPACGQPP